MDWRLQVTVAATHKKLAALADLKAQLGIADSGSDTELGKVIARRSAAMAAYCRLAQDQVGGRTFGQETLEVTFLATARDRQPALLLPWRVPVVSVTSIVENGVALSSTDYRLQGGAAIVERIASDGETPIAWSSRKIVVTFVAGWLCFDNVSPTVPEEVQAACLEECKVAWFSRRRDPLLRSEDVPDVYSVGYAVPGAVGGMESEGGLLATTAELLTPYRNPFPG